MEKNKIPQRIKQAIELISEWQEKSISFKPVYGGITNQNFKVIVDQKAYFLSVAEKNSDLLGVNFSNKYYNNKICDKLELSPKLIHFLESEGMFVSEFSPLPTLSVKSLQNADVQNRLIVTLKKLHNGPSFKGKFNIFFLIEHYLKIAQQSRIKFPAGFDDCLNKANTIRNALKPYQEKLVPCHNDLIPENILDDGQNIYLIDFDYSGQNDLYFELGNLCVEAKFNTTQSREFLKAYFGRIDMAIESKTYLNGIMSDIGWSLWSFIQSKISDIDFDFVTYGSKRWQRVAHEINSGEVDIHLKYL